MVRAQFGMWLIPLCDQIVIPVYPVYSAWRETVIRIGVTVSWSTQSCRTHLWGPFQFDLITSLYWSFPVDIPPKLRLSWCGEHTQASPYNGVFLALTTVPRYGGGLSIGRRRGNLKNLWVIQRTVYEVLKTDSWAVDMVVVSIQTPRKRYFPYYVHMRRKHSSNKFSSLQRCQFRSNKCNRQRLISQLER